MTFEEIWEFREEKIYKEYFGDTGQGIYTLTDDIFIKDFAQPNIDPRWVTYGVFECPPNKDRDCWVYVSSGMSNPWGMTRPDYQPNGLSGFGTEFTLETKEQSQWAIITLRKMVAYNILIACGRMAAKELIYYGDRIPLKSSIMINQESEIRNLVIGEPTHFPTTFTLYSGEVDLLHFIGVTDAELAYARQTTTAQLIDELTNRDIYPVTDPLRKSIF